MTFLRRLWNDSFLRTSALFLSGSGVIAVTNYLLHPVLSRLLSVSEFGEFQAFLALSTQCGIIFVAFTQGTIHASANITDPEKRAAIIRSFRNMSVTVAIVVSILIGLSAPFLAHLFRFQDPILFVLLACLMITSGLLTVRNGFLQGQSRFKDITFVSFIGSAGRLVFAVILITFGFQASGAVGGILFAQICALAYATWRTRGETASITRIPFPKNEFTFLLFAFLLTTFSTVLYSTDILVIKFFFPSTIAGLYSAVSTVANIVVFVSLPIVSVMLPSVKTIHDHTINRRNLQKTLLAVLAVGGSATIFFNLFPSFVVQLLMGPRYLPLSDLLRWQSIAFFLSSLTSVFLFYGIALRRYRFVPLILIDATLLFMIIVGHHSTPFEVIQSYLLVASFGLFGSIVLTWKDLTHDLFNRHHSNAQRGE